MGDHDLFLVVVVGDGGRIWHDDVFEVPVGIVVGVSVKSNQSFGIIITRVRAPIVGLVSFVNIKKDIITCSSGQTFWADDNLVFVGVNVEFCGFTWVVGGFKMHHLPKNLVRISAVRIGSGIDQEAT